MIVRKVLIAGLLLLAGLMGMLVWYCLGTDQENDQIQA